MAAEEAVDVDSLVAESFTTRDGRPCWGEHVSPDVARYIEALRAAMAEGRKPVWARVTAILRERFAIMITGDTAKRHVTGGCRCQK